MDNNNGEKFKKLLRKVGEATTDEYPENLKRDRRETFIRWRFSRLLFQFPGCFIGYPLLIIIIFVLGKILQIW